MKQLTKITGRTEAVHQYIAFGTYDSKGRAVGCCITTYEITYGPTDEKHGYIYEPGTYLIFHPWATRDGVEYGAVQNNRRFTTEEERAAAIDKYVKDARKRASK